MSETNREMAKMVYDSICGALDNLEIKYTKHDDDLVITFGHRGDDMSHDLLIAVNDKQEAIQVIERLPYEIDKTKAAEVAQAVCYVNNRLLLGKFTYDMEENLNFEIAQAYSGSLIGEETIKRIILALVFTVEDYDDKFMALNKGYLKPVDFAN